MKSDSDESEVPKHSLSDDLLGIFSGTFLAALGVFFLNSAGIVTGGTAGLALLVSYVTDIPFGILFFAVNVPFFLLAIRKKGWNFAIRSAISVALLSLFVQFNSIVFGELTISTGYAAIGGNLLTGVGLLILFRHKSSLGGFNILALLAQERLGLRAGYVQLALDALIVLTAIAVVPISGVLLSAIGVLTLNIVLAKNHRPGRYQGY